MRLTRKKAFEMSLAKWARAMEGDPNFDPRATDEQPCGLCLWSSNICCFCPLEKLDMGCDDFNSPWVNYCDAPTRATAAAMYLALLMARDATQEVNK